MQLLEQLQIQNTDLQRKNISLSVDLEKYAQWAGDSGVEELVQRLETLQDAMFQLKQATDVSLLVDSSSQIQKLIQENETKQKII